MDDKNHFQPNEWLTGRCIVIMEHDAYKALDSRITYMGQCSDEFWEDARKDLDECWENLKMYSYVMDQTNIARGCQQEFEDEP